MKQVFGKVEVIFDIAYLVSATIIGAVLLCSFQGNPVLLLAGIRALVLTGGDAFHLLPRVASIITGKEEQFRLAFGKGKQITSITMTIFYLFLWHIGLIVFSLNNMNLWTYILYVLAVLRIALCLMPQNRWQEHYPPVSWGIWRNIPFFLQGILVVALFSCFRDSFPKLRMVSPAVLFSFLFYLPVVLWVHKYPKLGALMLPKTSVYLWLLAMFLSL